MGGASGGQEVFDPFPRCPLEGGRQVGLPVRPPLSLATPRRADFLWERAFHFRHWFSGANEVGIGECQQEGAEHRGMTVEFEDTMLHKGTGISDPELGQEHYREATSTMGTEAETADFYAYVRGVPVGKPARRAGPSLGRRGSTAPAPVLHRT